MTDPKMVLAKNLAPACIPVGKTIMKSRVERKRMEEMREHEMELVEVRARKMDDPDAPVGDVSFSEDGEAEVEDRDPLIEAAELAEDLDARLEEALEIEECGFCREVLLELRTRPLDVQKRGIRELQMLHEAMYTDGSRQAVDSVMDDMEVVPQIIAESEATQ